MSQDSLPYTTISVREEDKQAFNDTLGVVREELGDDITQSDALRELAEAYRGGDALGGWRDK